jgi:hypothetical protein
MARGEIFSNDFRLFKTRIENPVVNVTQHYSRPGGFRKEYTGNGTVSIWGQLPTVPTYDVGDLASKAITAAFAKVDASPWLALASVAEARKIVQLLFDMFVEAGRIFRNLRRGQFRTALLRTSKDARKKWLAYRYGFRPLYYEVKNAVDALQTWSERPPRYTFRASSEDLITDTSERIHQGYSNFLRFRRESKVEASAHAGVLCDMSMTSLDKIRSGFGLDRVLETAWELTPYSFIADWFANTGDVIASWTPKIGVNVRSSWCTTICRASAQEVFDADLGLVYNGLDLGASNNIADTSFTITAEPYSTSVEEVARWSNPARPLIPSLDVRLDVSKIVDLLAIFKRK